MREFIRTDIHWILAQLSINIRGNPLERETGIDGGTADIGTVYLIRLAQFRIALAHSCRGQRTDCCSSFRLKNIVSPRHFTQTERAIEQRSLITLQNIVVNLGAPEKPGVYIGCNADFGRIDNGVVGDGGVGRLIAKANALFCPLNVIIDHFGIGAINPNTLMGIKDVVSFNPIVIAGTND